MVITGIKHTRIIHELPPKWQPIMTPGLARRVLINSYAGMTIHQIAAKLGVSKSVVVRTLAWIHS